MSDPLSKPIIYFDWNQGLVQLGNRKLDIVINGVNTVVENVKFFDTVRGFIETDTAIYMPDALKENTLADQD